jgi:hypothetical protein
LAVWAQFGHSSPSIWSLLDFVGDWGWRAKLYRNNLNRFEWERKYVDCAGCSVQQLLVSAQHVVLVSARHNILVFARHNKRVVAHREDGHGDAEPKDGGIPERPS